MTVFMGSGFAAARRPGMTAKLEFVTVVGFVIAA